MLLIDAPNNFWNGALVPAISLNGSVTLKI